MKEICLQQITQVRLAITSNTDAYTYRSRLGRLIVTCLRSVTKKLGLPQPILPGLYKVPSDASLAIKNVINCCNKLWELSRVLSQPSEPLESRWKTGWEELNCELDLLYGYILKVDGFETLNQNLSLNLNGHSS